MCAHHDDDYLRLSRVWNQTYAHVATRYIHVTCRHKESIYYIVYYILYTCVYIYLHVQTIVDNHM